MSGERKRQNYPQKASRVRAGDRLARLDELIVDVDQLVAGGDGLARYEGIPIFVPRTAPGDRVHIRLVARKPDYGRGEVIEVLRPGPGRREAPCPHYEACGGCDLQHLEDELQVALKAQAVVETLRRLSGIERLPQPEVVTGPAWSYRCRAQLHTEPGVDEVAVGYRARKSSSLVSVRSCPVLVPELETLLPSLPSLLPPGSPRRIDLLVGDSGALSTAPVVETLPHGPVEISVDDFRYELDARCFFQGHRQLLPRLVRSVIGEWQGETAVDLYSGVGLFSLPLGERYRRVIAVEGDRISARYARQNAKRNRSTGLEIVSKAVESWIGSMPNSLDRIVMDPPRAGLTQRARQQILAKRPQRITYVSCHAAALARDLKTFLPEYRLDTITLLDLFPQTGHMEAVVQLSSIRASSSDSTSPSSGNRPVDLLE